MTEFWDSVQTWLANEPTWDSLFAAIAPNVLQESGEKALRDKIASFLLIEYYNENIDALLDDTNKEDISNKISEDDLSQVKAAITNEDFGTILVQLKALGLIIISERKRSVSDTGTYWALTPYGETRTVQLRAIKKTSDIASTDESAAAD